MATFYTQCRLVRDTWTMTTWIPKQFAVPGKVLVFKYSDYKEKWVVVSCGRTESAEYVLGHQRDHLQQRAASDV